MKRDGALKSLWQNEVTDYTSSITMAPEQTFDVVIVGGGMTGIVTGLLLQKEGKHCLIAEAHTICFGTTGGTTAHLNTFLDATYDQIQKDFGEDDAQLVYKATRQALDLVKSHVEEYKIDCGYEEKDGYLFSKDDKQTDELEKIFKASIEAGEKVEYTDKIPISIGFEKAIVFHHQAQFHPSKYVHALATAFEKAGGVLLQNCKITDVDAGDPLTIASSLGTIKAHRLIYATHIPPGINLLHFRCAPYRSYAMATTLTDDNYPDGLAYDMYDPYHYYRTQEVNGKKYLIAGGEDHKTAHEANTDECFTRLENHLDKYFKLGEIAFKWSSQYFQPADGLAYIGTLPGNSEQIMVATGYGGNGMTYSHIAAIIFSELIIKNESEYAELFDPTRIKMVAGFSAFVKENADFIGQFIGKRFGQEKLESFAGLVRGEGKVVKYDGDSIALYKDDKGNLFALNPVCTHAKCIVSWNNSEKSWDCPCHGARYDVMGQVLTGPARKNLEVIDIGRVEA
ncbi:MAG: FAD-dependent oxidoreductase [Bacteroidota bacterium]|nr:FAD-dependent oxidoreductase [Bacteroidota bacterium]